MNPDRLEAALRLVQDQRRARTVDEVVAQALLFVADGMTYDDAALAKAWKDPADACAVLVAARDTLAACPTWDRETYEGALTRLGEAPLFLGAVVLTAFNDNAAITYLASLVPGFTDGLKYAVVAGAVTGGGLTVIANAPNPAGQAILARHFPGGVAPLSLALAALGPTAVMAACFMLGR